MSWISDLSRLFSFLMRWARGIDGIRALLVVVVLAGLVSGLCNAAFIALINAVLTRQLYGSPAALGAFAGLCLLLPLSRFVSGSFLLRLTGRSIFGLRVHLARQILGARLRHLESLGTSRLVANLTEDIPAIITALIVFPAFLMQVFIIAGCLAYLGWLSWPVLAAVVVFMTLGLLSYQLPMSRATRFLTGARRDADRLMAGIRALTQGTKELKLNSRRRAAFLADDFEAVAGSLERNSMAGQRVLLAATTWGHILFFLLIGLVVFGVPAARPVDPGVLAGYTLVILYMMAPLEGIMSALPTLARASVAVRAVERLDEELQGRDGEPAAGAGPGDPGRWGTLELAGVLHTYQSEDRIFTLGPLDLRLEPGELVFITGGNGCGKTTLAKVLCGLYTPEAGEIRLAGEPVTDANRDAYRQHFSAVFSDFFVFDRLLGLAGEDLDGQAQAHLRMLGLDKLVRVEQGRLSTVDVSQGQRKRLALLTAYLEDRPVYLFDEWAADQDPAFKEVFYRRLLPELKEAGKTVFVISHDDRYFDAADRVVKLEEGSVVFDGRVQSSAA